MTRILTALAGWKGYALTAALCIAFGFGSGWTVRDWKARADQSGELTEKVRIVERVVERERQQADVTAAVETQAAEAQVQIRTVTRTIVERVPVYVTPDADDRCVVPAGFVRLHDAAARDPLSEPAGQPDDPAARAEASGVTLSRIAAVTAENYGAYHAVARQLTDLQDWVRRQQAVANGP